MEKQKENLETLGIHKRKTAQQKEIYAARETTDKEEKQERKMKAETMRRNRKKLEEIAKDVKQNGSDTKSNLEDWR